MNRYGITLTADPYIPKEKNLLYLQHADRLARSRNSIPVCMPRPWLSGGYLTIAFDPSFTGESGGKPRYMSSSDINTEDFMTAVDCLSTQESVDPGRTGIIGICGWVGMDLNATALDKRFKAVMISAMYDMARFNADGYFDSEGSEDAR